jgi:hypothetical protein
LTCDDPAVEGWMIAGGRTPIEWGAYARSAGCGGGFGSARRIRR